MSASKLFSSSKQYFSRKHMRKNFRTDPVFRKIMESSPALKEELDRRGELKRVHDLILEKAKDGKFDIHDARKTAYSLAHGQVEEISCAEGRSVARAIFPDSSRRYEHDKPESEKGSDNISKSRNIRSSSRSDSVIKANKVAPAYFTYRSKSVAASSDSGKNKKVSYYDAMQSVRRNKISS